jgi:hypothetical protein
MHRFVLIVLGWAYDRMTDFICPMTAAVIAPPAYLGACQPEAGFLVRVHPEPCLILSRAKIRALLCSSKSKFIPA